MDQGNVQSRTGVTLVGGGNPQAADIAEALRHAPCLVAADGGANFCLSAGAIPVAVIGDLDSISAEARAAFPGARMIEVEDQETTDFEKCLARIEAPFVLATGFTSGRLDHTLAALSVMARRVGPPALLIDAQDVAFAAPQRLAIDLPPGTRISLFPLEPVRGSSKGLRWPIDGLRMEPAGRIGTSNVATGPVSIDFDRPGCIILLPRTALVRVLPELIG